MTTKVLVTSADLANASLTQRVLDLEEAIAGLQARFNKLEDTVNDERESRTRAIEPALSYGHARIGFTSLANTEE